MLTLTEQFFQEGVAEGEAKGRAAGRAAGIAEGRVKALSHLLERRFGPLSPAPRGLASRRLRRKSWTSERIGCWTRLRWKPFLALEKISGSVGNLRIYRVL